MSKEIEKDMLFMTEGDKELRTLEEELEKLLFPNAYAACKKLLG